MAAGDSQRKQPAPLERVPPAKSNARRAERPGGGAAVVYLRPCGGVTWARWNARLVGAPHSTARLAPLLPRPALCDDVIGAVRGRESSWTPRPARCGDSWRRPC